MERDRPRLKWISVLMEITGYPPDRAEEIVHRLSEGLRFANIGWHEVRLDEQKQQIVVDGVWAASTLQEADSRALSDVLQILVRFNAWEPELDIKLVGSSG